MVRYRPLGDIILQDDSHVYKIFEKEQSFNSEYNLYLLMKSLQEEKGVPLVPDFEVIESSSLSIDVGSRWDKALKLKRHDVIPYLGITVEDKQKLRQKLDILEEAGIYLLDLGTDNLVRDGDDELLFIDLQDSLYPNCETIPGHRNLVRIYSGNGDYKFIIENHLEALKALHIRQLEHSVGWEV